MINISATRLRKNLSNYLDLVADQNEIIRVKTKNGNAVIISEHEYNGLMETLHIYSIPGMKERIIEGLNIKLEDCMESEDEF
jgi:PHD/YefM family antitoxin component YafN of YafNO toxin-antitoxin module